MEKKKKKKLYKPQNVPEKKYAVKGFTYTTLAVIVSGFLIGGVFGVFNYVRTDNILWILIPVGVLGAIPTMLLVEDEHGENFIFWIMQSIRYFFEQHQFEYKKYNIYERKFYGESEEDREQ